MQNGSWAEGEGPVLLHCPVIGSHQRVRGWQRGKEVGLRTEEQSYVHMV